MRSNETGGIMRSNETGGIMRSNEICLRIARVTGRIAIGDATSHDKYPNAHIDLLYKSKKDDDNLFRTVVSSDKMTAEVAFSRRDVAMFKHIKKDSIIDVAYPPLIFIAIDGETYTA